MRSAMIPPFTTGFLDLLKRVLPEGSKGVKSSHHVHNIQVGVANIRALLKYDAEIDAAADHVTQMAALYLNRHDVAATAMTEQERRADGDRFGAAQDAL